ncbi:Annexin [Tilletiaria anomala UBC 951]|uniref:Annexin n=1 Tax=Tilletiaria anomala (strain ATCC 24038 / CBS 436.72 / UBC 951) TaxID=1037660 RepID=A0A066VUX5_TILAU|nr:Annexin [Tilletiaria anomala UBC 951]KDN44088.1 Annexin [Tilletiaria anomala UBC 951]
MAYPYGSGSYAPNAGPGYPQQPPYGGVAAYPYPYPPQQQPYGAPGLGAHPQQQQQQQQQQQPPVMGGGYHSGPLPLAAAAPPLGSMGMALTYNGIPVPPPPPAPPGAATQGLDVHGAVERIYKAMKGFGTDERTLTLEVCALDPFAADAVCMAYKSQKGKDVVAHVESETSGSFEAVLRAKLLGPVLFDAYTIHRACAGIGTDEDALTEVLLARSNSDIYMLKQAFQATYGKPLERVVDEDLSFKTKRLFAMALAGGRIDEHVPPTAQQVQADVATLYNSMRGAGTDETAACGVLCSRNNAQLIAIAEEYRRTHGKLLSAALDNDFSGHMRAALVFIARGAEPATSGASSHPLQPHEYGIARDARLLADGFTNDRALVRRVLRAHWDTRRWVAVKAAFQAHHKRGLAARVKSEISGDYQRALLAVIGAT